MSDIEYLSRKSVENNCWSPQSQSSDEDNNYNNKFSYLVDKKFIHPDDSSNQYFSIENNDIKKLIQSKIKNKKRPYNAKRKTYEAINCKNKVSHSKFKFTFEYILLYLNFDYCDFQVKDCFHVWEFLRDMLKDEKTNEKLIKWLDIKEGLFKIIEPNEISKIWGNLKNSRPMKYSNMARGIR